MYRAAADVRAATWLGAGLHGFGESVLSVVPDGFSDYVRVFHPASRSEGSEPVAVSWAEIAAANGMRMHPGVQLGSITGSEAHESQGQPGVFDQPPATGTLPAELLDPLLAVLAGHTSTPGICWFAVWEGWGWLPPEVRSAPRFALPQRSYHLLDGPIEAVREVTDEVQPLGGGHIEPVRELADAGQPPGPPRNPPWLQSPSLWWPEDHAWCVATEIDLKTTYIGADRACARELIAVPEIEASPVSPDLGIDWLSDRVNPRQTSA